MRACKKRQQRKVLHFSDNLETEVNSILDAVHEGLFNKAKKNLDENIFKAKTVLEAKEIIETKGRFY